MNFLRVLREHRLAAAILVGFIVLDVFLLAMPSFGVYDEVIYIPVSYNLMRLQPRPLNATFLGAQIGVFSPFNITRFYPNRTLGQDFNVEQPPLGKLIMGTFLYVFAPNTVSFFWARVPSVIMSIIALISMYGIGLSLFESKRWALLGMVFLNFDTLFWISSRLALLDIYTVAFMMVGILLFLKNRFYSSMFFFALSILSKLTGLFGLGFVIVYALVMKRESLKTVLKRCVLGVGVCLGLVAGFYTAYVQVWGMSHNPVTNFLLYLKWVKGVDWTFTLVAGGADTSEPWQWFFNQVPVHFGSIIEPNTGLTEISFIGQLNLALIALAIPVLAWCGYEIFKERKPVNTLPFTWFLGTWLPLLMVSFLGAEQYIHHALAFSPAIVLAIVAWLRTQSKVFTVSYSFFVFASWLMAYPYAFLILYLVGVHGLPPLNFFYGA